MAALNNELIIGSGLTEAGTGATYSLPVTADNDGWQVYAVITDGDGNTMQTETATMAVNRAAIYITAQPQDYTGPVGNTATFTVTAVGVGLTYRWQYYNPNTGAWANTTVSGYRTPTISVPITTGRNGLQYRCMITDTNGNQLASDPGTLVVGYIAITKQPQDVIVATAGASSTMTIEATGDGLTYAWYYKNPGAANFTRSSVTATSYSIAVTEARDGRQQYCLVTDENGNTLQSRIATLSIATEPIVITEQPRDAIVLEEGDTATFTVGAVGTGLTYQWYISGWTFDNASINHISGVFAVDVVGNELTIDTVTATVRYTGAGNVRAIPYATKAWWYNDGTLRCVAYVRNVERVGRYLYKINMISGVGLLDNYYHAGGVYTGETFAEIAAEIIGSTFDYTVAPAVASQQVYGWLPYATARANLHQLMFALGAALRKDADGAPRFVFLSETVSTTIPDGRIAVGGNVNYETAASGVEVTEHSYSARADDDEITLYEGDALPVNNALIVFDQAPVHDLTATSGLTIEEQGVNYAIVSGIGTLTGKLYTHLTRTVTRYVDATPSAENIKRVTDMTLISVLNSSNVAKRVLAYYSSAETIRAQVVIEGEHCGDVLRMSDPYYDKVTAFLAQADINASANLLGNCILVEGYTPTGQGNNASGSVALTGSGTWTVPDDVTEITVVLVGGGDGGTAGSAGTAAAVPVERHVGNRTGIVAASAIRGEGGASGTAGSGGRVYVATISVTPGASLAYATGAGGAGEIFGGTAAQSGGASTFGSLTSASGAVPVGGYVDPISGDVLATEGDPGHDGCAGNGYDGDGNIATPESITVDGVTWFAGAFGQTVTESGSGQYGAVSGIATGGFGGGAAYGSNGYDGQDGQITYAPSSSRAMTVYAARGGNGADAAAPPAPATYGRGGAGGNGGGGGGAVGVPAYVDGESLDVLFYAPESPAQGGAGSNGGQGADGCILIYY